MGVLQTKCKHQFSFHGIATLLFSLIVFLKVQIDFVLPETHSAIDFVKEETVASCER